MSETPSPGTDGGIFPFLDEARRRLVDRLQHGEADLPGAGLLVRELDEVAGMVEAALEAGGRVPAASSRAAPMGLRLLELLRTELLREWPEDAADRPSLRSVMGAFEAVRARLCPDEAEYLGAPVLDPWARELLGEVAHTLGSTFGSMVFLTEVLASGQSGPVTELQESQLRILYRAALTVGSAAGDVLRLTGPLEEPGARDDEAGSPSVAQVLAEVASMLEPVAREKGWEIEVNAPPEVVRVERPLTLKRILLGLALALADVADRGPCRLAAETGDDGRVAFSIETGAPRLEDGEPSPLASVFQEHPHRDGAHFSVPGLGVAAARRLLRRMGSDLAIEDEDDTLLRLRFAVPPSPE